ncbi:hypothetical protein PRVXT_002633 [Proteinivorax tanatarense]|uniref:Uncharacterized protein n=1 Tax=Proteinivorax tanatarense TaxID=1260629 RepID=A0AAU7VKG7_9FIRM
MTELMSIFKLVYVVIFFAAIFVVFKFDWSKEGQDERGKEIMNKSYGFIFPLVPFGWFVLHLFDKYVRPFSLEEYKWAVWFLVTSLMILHGILVTIYKKKL